MTKKVEKKDTAEVILQAAAARFRSQGIGDTTLREIAAEAGVLLGTVHYWFPTKESILLALTERAAEIAVQTIEDAITGETDPARRLWLAFRAYLNALVYGDSITTVLLYEYRPRDNEEWAAVSRLRERFDRTWDGLLHQAVGAGCVRGDVNVSIVRLLSLGAINWIPMWYSEQGEMDLDEILDHFMNLFARGVFVPEGAQPWHGEGHQASPRQSGAAGSKEPGASNPSVPEQRDSPSRFDSVMSRRRHIQPTLRGRT